jgi:hypothetical protein
MTDFQYLNDLQVLVEDEILLLKYEPEFRELDLAYEIRHKWEEERNLETFNQWLADKFTSLVPSFVSDVADESDNAFDESLLLRFFTLTNVIIGTKEFHKSIQAQNKQIIGHSVFGSTDNLIYASICLLIGAEFPKFLSGLAVFKIPEFIRSWIQELDQKIQNFLQIINLKEIDKIINQIYALYEYVADFIDFLDQEEFELEEDEVEGLNQILSWILYVHGILYNFLLVTEKLIDLEEQNQNLSLKETKEILEEHDTRLEMMKMLANEPKN